MPPTKSTPKPTSRLLEDPFTNITQTLPPFNFLNLPLLPRPTSFEIIAEPDSQPSPPRTPPSQRTSQTPSRSAPDYKTPDPSSPKTPSPSTRRNPPSNASKRTPSSTASKRSLDTEGDVKMRNGAYTSPDRRYLQSLQAANTLQSQIQAAVHDNFEFERARFVEDVRGAVLDSLADEVAERVDVAIVAAAGEPEGSELDAVVAVRERLRRMGEEGLVRVLFIIKLPTSIRTIMTTEQTLHEVGTAFIRAFDTLDETAHISLRAPSCTHTFAPASMGPPPPMTNAELAAHLAKLRLIMTGFPVTAKEIHVNVPKRQVLIWATAVAEFKDEVKGLKEGENGTEWDYVGEYMFFLTVDKERKISRVVEFVDSLGTKRVWGLMSRAWENAGVVQKLFESGEA
ncbi:hypothetical protein CGCSCA5_v008273 [Colletotrichum siamense]|nr:hypothetical protein CGCSCA5_v008273 [Colletotrichum siamense]